MAWGGVRVRQGSEVHERVGKSHITQNIQTPESSPTLLWFISWL